MSMIKRKIHFYTIAANPPDGNDRAERVDVERLLQEMAAIKDNPEEIFVSITEEEELAFWINKDSFPIQLKFGVIRRKDFPLMLNSLNLEELQLDGDGLVEISHMVFWDNGIVGVEYNHRGPKVRKFQDYILQKFSTHIFFQQIVNRNIDQVLSEFKGLSSIKIGLRASMLDSFVGEDANLVQALDNFKNLSEAEIIEFNLKNNDCISERFVRIFRSLVGTNNSAALTNARIEGELREGGRREHNLLNDLLFYTVQAVRISHSKAVDSQDMFNKIQTVYNDNEDRLLECKRIEYY